MTRPIRFGIQTAPQNTTWPELREAWKLIDELGYDTAWVFDHFYSVLGDPSGPCFEGWTALTALAAATARVKLGVLVTGNTYRHPAVLAKMGATVDHISNGRLIMGLGAGWFELEHTAYGIPFYTTAERIRRLGEAADIIKRLWTEKQVSFDGRYYPLKDAYCEPKPLQSPRPPLLIGGSGEKLTLRVVAQHADVWNMFGSPEVFHQKLGVLQEHCAQVGRRRDTIEVSWAGVLSVTDSKTEREEMIQRAAQAFHQPAETIASHFLIGSVAEIRERIQQFIQVGVTHFIMSLSAPFDHRLIRRFAEEVMVEFRR